MKIPKQIHFVWIGGTLPEKYAGAIEHTKSLNPDFSFKVWYLDDCLQEEGVDERIRQKLSALAGSGVVAHRVFASVIMRYFILYRYGGWYLDTDFVAYKGISTLDISPEFEFIASLMHPSFALRYNNCISACIPGHRIPKIMYEIVCEKEPKLSAPLYNQVVIEHMDEKTLSLNWRYFLPVREENIDSRTVMFHTHDHNWQDDPDFKKDFLTMPEKQD